MLVFSYFNQFFGHAQKISKMSCHALNDYGSCTACRVLIPCAGSKSNAKTLLANKASRDIFSIDIMTKYSDHILIILSWHLGTKAALAALIARRFAKCNAGVLGSFQGILYRPKTFRKLRQVWHNNLQILQCDGQKMAKHIKAQTQGPGAVGNMCATPAKDFAVGSYLKH